VKLPVTVQRSGARNTRELRHEVGHVPASSASTHSVPSIEAIARNPSHLTSKT
jgi:hypothetical protein